MSCLALAACGGGNKLSFKNSDEVIKSYKSVTANMTEAERLEFRRNMFLVAWTSEKPEDEVTVSDIETAWHHERNTLDLTGPDATPVAKELALKGLSKLDGKTAAQVNALGASLSYIAVNKRVQTTEEKIAELDTTIAQLNADKEEWNARKEQAIAAEAAFVAETKAYNPTIKSAKIGKNWRGPVLQGKLTMTSPHADPINDFRNNFTVEHNGYVVRYNRVLGQLSGSKKESGFNLNLDPKTFTNASGASLAADYVMPKELSAYNYSFRPEWVRTSGKVNGWQEHEYKLDPTLAKAFYQLPAALKACDQSIDVAKKLRVSFEEQIDRLKNNEFDDLKRISGRFAESCL